MELLIVIGGLSLAYLFTGVYTEHRQTARRRRRAVEVAVIAAVHRQDFEQSIKAIGGSGGRR
jgi:hypothetical protein